MKHFFLLILFFPLLSWSQVKEFDNLEMLYSQGHYKTVYKKSIRLLDNPEFDYSLLPRYYKSLAIFQLFKIDGWRKRNPEKLGEAKLLFLTVKKEDQGGKLFSAHYYEIQSLKRDMQAFLELTKQQGNEDLFEKSTTFVTELFKNVPDSCKDEGTITNLKELPSVTINTSEDRKKLIELAEGYLGTPYKWAGQSPKGFDCSGFTCYIMHEFGKTIPRSSDDQYKDATKIKIKEAQPGDLIFFDSGSGINHVGIVVSNDGETINMIHSSTSSGVILTNIAASDYWSKRLKAVGSYLR